MQTDDRMRKPFVDQRVEKSAQCAHRVGGDGMALEFGIFDHLDRNDLPLCDYYEQRLKVIEAFDRSGFYAYHVAEHHFTPLGMAPSPSVFLSAIGQRDCASARSSMRSHSITLYAYWKKFACSII